MRNSMMTFGLFPFCLDTVGFTSLKRTIGHRIVNQDTINHHPVVWNVGVAPETIEIEGLIAPGFKGGLLQVEWLKRVIEGGEPHMLLSGLGHIFGRYIATQFEEVETHFLPWGVPQSIHFRITFQSVENDSLLKRLEALIPSSVKDTISKGVPSWLKNI